MMNDAYSVIFKYYDEFVGADYEKISSYILDCISAYKNDSSLVLDLCCGSGKITKMLSQKGYDMIAVDNSNEMLQIAMENSEGQNILYLNQDMRSFELYGTVDAVISTLDSINYLNNLKELEKVFSLIRNYLNFDGLFIFDINSENYYKNIISDNNFVFENDNAVLLWQNDFKKKNADFYLTLFEKENDKYNRFDEYQRQHYFSINEIKKTLKKYDFEILKITDNYSDKKLSKKTNKITFVTRTKKR